MDEVIIEKQEYFCHLYSMYRFLLSCHNKRPSYDFYFIIEEPSNLQKKFHTLGLPSWSFCCCSTWINFYHSLPTGIIAYAKK